MATEHPPADARAAAGTDTAVDPASPGGGAAFGWLPDAFAVDDLAFFLEAGGPVVLILLVLSVVATTIVLAKLWQFRAHRLGCEAPVLDAAALLRQGEPARAVTALGALPHPAAVLIRMAAQAGTTSAEALRDELTRIGRRQLAALRSHFRALEIIAALAPLLGLFGTVLGMIGAFRAMEAAGGAVDPAVLSGGIWQALLTTAVGLAVAMPSVAALALLERRVERVAETMEDVLTQILAPPLPRVEAPVAPRAPALAHEAG
ncbi:MAG: MotA/TolQ/ExbB proton channel family protein [Alphaproteobacteria bacterium]